METAKIIEGSQNVLYMAVPACKPKFWTLPVEGMRLREANIKFLPSDNIPLSILSEKIEEVRTEKVCPPQWYQAVIKTHSAQVRVDICIVQKVFPKART